jgi:predicted nucleic acid-binding protein
VIVYCDTSALTKLVVAEPESRSLRSWLRRQSRVSLVVNVLGSVELQRVAARVGPDAYRTAILLLARLDLLELGPTTLTIAATLPPPTVRTIDALHVASAAELPDLDVLVTYDDRMAEAARGYGLDVASPGRT